MICREKRGGEFSFFAKDVIVGSQRSVSVSGFGSVWFGYSVEVVGANGMA